MVLAARPVVSPLTGYLDYWLRLVANQGSEAFARRLGEAGFSMAEWVILRTLYGGKGQAPSSVAEAVGLSRGRVSRVIDGLVERSLVLRVGAQKDRRFQELNLSPTGEVLVERLAVLADDHDQDHFSALGGPERGHLMTLLKKIVASTPLRQGPKG